ncbi:MAG: molybdopterin dinucleotide binding domain-containing protein [Gemmatimonadota bacterium]|nr:molybdopterin dinucleotide binding domain-containing protein [Gemmatimonadota bacterium]
MGFQGFDYEGPDEVFNELCALSPIYQGLDWDRVDEGRYQWPVPHAGHSGTPRLHEDVFENGRGIFKLTTYRDPAEVVDDAYPVWLTTGRRLQSYHTHTQTGRTEGIGYLLPGEVLEVHPGDVARWGLEDGGVARVSSRRGSVDVTVQANPRSPSGTVFLSFSFADVPVNVLTGGGYDPVTQTPEVKVCPVRIEPLRRDSSGIGRQPSALAESGP